MRTALEIVRPIVVAALAVLAGEGCFEQPKPASDPSDDYYMKQQACVLTSATLAESKACRARVDAEYGVKR